MMLNKIIYYNANNDPTEIVKETDQYFVAFYGGRPNKIVTGSKNM